MAQRRYLGLKTITITAFLILVEILCGCEQSEESKVKDACRQFIDGRIALKDGDSLKLKEVAEDSVYKMIMLNHEYLTIVGQAPVIEADLQMRVGAVKIEEGCASCEMLAMYEYVLKLCKEGETWKVRGENDIYPTTDMIQRTEKKIRDYKLFLKDEPARDSVLTVVNTFFDAAKQYFKQPGDGHQLPGTDAATARVVRQLYAASQKRTNPATLSQEIQQPNYMVGDVEFNKDKATFKFYNEETYINLRKINNAYIITGFNNLESRYITEAYINTNYVNLLRTLKLIRNAQYRSKGIQ